VSHGYQYFYQWLDELDRVVIRCGVVVPYVMSDYMDNFLAGDTPVDALKQSLLETGHQDQAERVS
jgi:hypothetical protein